MIDRTELERNLATRSRAEIRGLYGVALGAVGKRLAAFLDAEEGSSRAERLSMRLRHAEEVVMAAGSKFQVKVVRGGTGR